MTRGQVLAVIENRSSDWVTVPTGASRYTILDQAGRRSASGAFAYAFPQRLPPGGSAYLVDMIDASFAELATLAEVTVEPVVVSSEPVAGGIVVTDVIWAKVQTGGLTASGSVKNIGATEVRDVIVAIVFLNAAGNPLSVIYDPVPYTLGADESRTFTTAYPNTGPVNLADILRVEPVAGPYQP